MIEVLRGTAAVTALAGLFGTYAVWPAPAYNPSGSLFVPSASAFMVTVFVVVALLTAAEVLGHLRAIRGRLAPVVVSA